MSAFDKARAMGAYARALPSGGDARMIVLLHDGAIAQVGRARSAIQEKAPESRWRHVSKATAIVEGLQGCLDHTAGAEIASLLDRFYTYITLRLQQINVRDDIGICDEIVAHLSTMRASWIAAAERLTSVRAMASAAAPAIRTADLRS